MPELSKLFLSSSDLFIGKFTALQSPAIGDAPPPILNFETVLVVLLKLVTFDGSSLAVQRRKTGLDWTAPKKERKKRQRKTGSEKRKKETLLNQP